MCYRVMVVLLVTSLLTSSLTRVSSAPADREGRQTLLRYMFDSLFRQSTELPPDYESTVDIAHKAGFEAEAYTVQTEDGYLLTVHHLLPLPPTGHELPAATNAPSSNSTSSVFPTDDNLLDRLSSLKEDPDGLPKDSSSSPGRPTKVVFLQHGLMGSSDNWNTNAKDDCLAYLLAKAGYDVWMGNFRGNVYSRRHINMTHADPQFWKFSYDEMAKYDLPVMLDFVLERSGAPNLHYIGHSMGTTVFFALMSSRPSYQHRVASMIALAPVATVRDIVSPIKYLAPFINEIHSMLRMFGSDQDIVTNRLLISLWDPYQVCRNKGLCENIQFIITGFDPERANQNMVPMILSHNPAGTSTQTLLHFAQGVNSGTFQKYDLGRERNLQQYGQEKPPEYDLSSLKVPVTLFWAENDWMTGKRDINHLEKTIPGFVRSHCVENPKFSHLDFLWANDANRLVYKRILEHLNTESNTVPPDTRRS